MIILPKMISTYVMESKGLIVAFCPSLTNLHKFFKITFIYTCLPAFLSVQNMHAYMVLIENRDHN